MARISRPVVVLVMAYLTMFLGSSLMTATGVIYIALLQEYQQSVAMTSWVGSLFQSFFCLGGPLAGSIINSYGCRTCIIVGGILNITAFTASSICNNLYVMYITFGLLGGLGQCFGYTGAYVSVGFYYQGQQSLATGIVVSGYAMGQIIYPFFTQLLMEAYHLDGTLLILGAIGFEICVLGSCIRPHSIERQNKKSRGVKKSRTIADTFRNCIAVVSKFFQILKNIPFLFFCLSIFCWAVSLSSSVMYITDYFHHTGSSLIEASYLTSMIGIGSIIARILVGLAASEGGLDGKLIYFGCYAIIGISTIVFSFYGNNYFFKVAYSIISGFYQGGTWTLLGPIAVELVGISDLATAFSMEMFFAGVGFLTVPLFGGLMYSMASILGLVMMAFSRHDILNQNSSRLKDKEIELNIQQSSNPKTDSEILLDKSCEDNDVSRTKSCNDIDVSITKSCADFDVSTALLES